MSASLPVEETSRTALTADVVRKARNLLNIPDWGPAHANIRENDIFWSVPIQRIPLKARFRLVNQVLVPMFASSSDLEMPMMWQAPPEVRLVFVVQTQCFDQSTTIAGTSPRTWPR